ncbi:MAG: MATE family efflux transporter [Clostridia bacterium]|nr:MATE family efflux transporter [Clostridia bacterium]
MGIMPVNKLLISMSLPMIISMIVQALYNVIDSIFVSYISENALTAVSLAFPAQNLMIAFASGTAVGVNALLSKSLGEKNFDKANKAAENGLFLVFIEYLIFLIFGIFGVRFFYNMQTDVAEIIEYGYSYMTVCSIFSFGVFGQIMTERLMQSTGRTIYTMFTQGAGAIINIILDPVLIFGLGFFPKMGIAGAAWATVIGQIFAFILALILNAKYNKDIKLSVKHFRPDKKIIGRIFSVGIPSTIMMAIGSVMNFMFNKILISFTETAAAVFGVYFKLQSFIFMPVFGMNNGIIPIIAYNYGAQKRKRMMKAVKLGIVYALMFMVAGLIIMQLFPEQLLSIFNATPDMVKIGIPALRTISICFVFAGFCIVIGSVFQALGRGTFSMIVSVARQLVVLIPAAYLLSLTGELNNVWSAFPIAEIASVIASAACFIYLYKKVIRKIPE